MDWRGKMRNRMRRVYEWCRPKSLADALQIITTLGPLAVAAAVAIYLTLGDLGVLRPLWPLLLVVLFAYCLWVYSLLRGLANPRPPVDALDERLPPERSLAKIEWWHGFRNSSIAEPWELRISVKFLRHAKDTSCYCRWGRLVYFIGGPPEWEWSKQTILLPSQPVHEGRVDEFVIASIAPKPPDNRFMDIFGDKLTGEQNQESTVCIEVVVASEQTQRERRYYGLASANRLVPVWINKSRLESVGA